MIKSKTREIADSVFTYGKTDNVFYYYQNCNSAYECDYVKYENGKSTTIANEVYYAITIGNNRYYVTKNHSVSNKTSDLYYYDGNKYQVIAYDVKDEYNSIYDISY